ncbi:MAG: ABC transporter ATP-binding protein [Clostridiales bacterium]|nr:ABC transporter ATP-binding protein [Clostridiales bacterium]
MITYQHIDAGYGKKMKIRDVSATFREGSLSVIIGPNGSGKSTFIKAMMGISHVGSGRILLDGKELFCFSEKERARKIAYLPQNRNTPSISAYRMVLHGRFPYLSYPRHYSAEDYRISMEAMERMGVAGLAEKPVAQLSGGERQKVYLAMALAGQADHLVLDEPSNFLDVKYQQELMKELKQLTKTGKAVITVLHDLNAAFRYADQVLVMDGGQLKKAGTVKEIYESSIIEQVFGLAIKKITDETGMDYFVY